MTKLGPDSRAKAVVTRTPGRLSGGRATDQDTWAVRPTTSVRK
jgi:hypothetical protein